MRYIALVDGKAGAYGVVVPDLPGGTSAGSTTDAALRNAVDAVRLWVEDAIDDGEALPPPRSVEELRAVGRAVAIPKSDAPSWCCKAAIIYGCGTYASSMSSPGSSASRSATRNICAAAHIRHYLPTN
jgi:predicted RNase H-like HicB family nuclease